MGLGLFTYFAWFCQLYNYTSYVCLMPIKPMGTGKTMVELFSAEMLFRVWRYLSCREAGLPTRISAACFKALLAFCSPSAAITCNVHVYLNSFMINIYDLTLALATRAASASVAIALCSCSGTLTSLTSTLSTVTPHGSVITSNVV